MSFSACECECSRSRPRCASLRMGIVRDQDASVGRVRVSFDEFDQMLSYWLPIVVAKTQDDKFYWLPDLGEQVVCLMDERDEDGVVLGAVYSQADTTPVQSSDKFHLGFKDGSAMEYDRAAHVASASFQDSSTFKYDSDNHVLSLSFEDGTTIRYDSGLHSLALQFGDGTALGYDASVHAFSILGGLAASVTIAVPAGIVLQSGGSFVKIFPDSVSIHPPLE